RGSPSRETAVGTAVHADSAVAPGLHGDPINDRPHILAIMLIRKRSTTALTFSPRVRDHADITMSRNLPRIARCRIRGIFEERGQSLPYSLWTDQDRGDTDAFPDRNFDVVLGGITPILLLGVERGHDRREVPKS